MRKQFLVLIAVLVLCIFFSCKRQPKWDEKVNYIANLECRAVAMRERRFALANELRFAQDTLSTTKSSSDSQRLTEEIKMFTKEKEGLLQHSLQLADTIHLQMDSLRKFVFADINERTEFDKRLSEALKQRGCNQ